MTQNLAQTQGLSNSQLQYNIAELMKPIKDLAQVWQIDIDPYIDQFLVQITNQLIMEVDFREAALIIQQTTQLFAKKVDFLYDFANQVLISQPGKQKKRRTTQQQSQDLIFTVDDELVDNFNQFFEVFSPANPKTVQTQNLFLLPKNPHTMLSARRVIENQDVRITPIFNCIHQSYALLLEQWDEHDLREALENNANFQPINHTTPVHPRYFEVMSTAFSEAVRRSGIPMLSSPQREKIVLIDQDQHNLGEAQEIPNNQDLDAAGLDLSLQAEPIELDIQQPQNDIQQTNEQKKRKQVIIKDFNLSELEDLNSIVEIAFSSLQQQQSEKDGMQSQPFKRLVVDKTPKQNLDMHSYLELIENDEDAIKEFVGYSTTEKVFTGIQTGLVRCYALQNVELQLQEPQQQPQLQFDIQPPQMQAEEMQLQQVLLPTQDQDQGQIPNRIDKKEQKKEERSKYKSTRLYTHEYVSWLHKLEQQISKQTVFDVIHVQNHVNKEARDFIEIRQLSKKLDVGIDHDSEKCKLARCFISSLFLANDGKAIFETSSDGIKVKIIK